MKVEETKTGIKIWVEKIHVYCDKCNKEIIVEEKFDAYEFTFERKEGNVFPEGGSLECHTMDLCKSCSLELIEQLKSFGYRINFHEAII
jgi:hypothetical protein